MWQFPFSRSCSVLVLIAHGRNPEDKRHEDTEEKRTEAHDNLHDDVKNLLHMEFSAETTLLISTHTQLAYMLSTTLQRTFTPTPLTTCLGVDHHLQVKGRLVLHHQDDLLAGPG